MVAVRPPLDLSLGATALDRALPLYRHYILRRLNHLVDIAHRKGLALPSSRSLRGVESIRVWDGLVVGPFFGFRDAEDYYTRASVAPLLAGITLPTPRSTRAPTRWYRSRPSGRRSTVCRPPPFPGSPTAAAMWASRPTSTWGWGRHTGTQGTGLGLADLLIPYTP